MKRRRKSTKPVEEEEENGCDEVKLASTSITNLPSCILIDILSRLSVKSIFRCRCVCKVWLNLLLDPDFVKLHFSRAPTCPLLRDANERSLSKALYLVELERDSIYDVCDKSCDILEFFCGDCDRKVNMKLRSIFMLPERETSSRTKIRERRFNVVNSCNGLLCLFGSLNGYPFVICNPVTGDYSFLPTPEEEGDKDITVCGGGLGFCPKSNQYKVLLMVSKWVLYPDMRSGHYKCNVALVYTLGLGPWRRIGNAPFIESGKSCPAFVNGALHWLVDDYEFANKKVIVSFDFEEEQFRALPTPPPLFRWDKVNDLLQFKHARGMSYPPKLSEMSLGILRGQLCVCDASSYDPIDIWVMRDYGVQESWGEEFSISTDTGERWPVGLYQPTDYLNNGDLLMYNERNALLSYDGYKYRYFRICGSRSKFQSIAHVPSFVLLKEVMGDDITVLNVRLTNDELQKRKAQRLVLVEEDREIMLPSSPSGDEGWW